MNIRPIHEQDYPELVQLYQKFFPTHNRFQKDEPTIISYLKEQVAKHLFLVAEEDAKIQGALFLVNFGQNQDGTHKLWKFRHFAFNNETTAAELLKAAEEKAKQAATTTKIELTIAENEKGIEFYKSHGYQEEGKLTNHYRWGEVCLVLGKSLQ